MSNTTSPPPGLPPPATPFDPLNQTSFLLYGDGSTPVPFNTFNVTQIYLQATSLSILYGTQIGACFMTLVVVLGMTPRARFRRLPTLVSVAALALNTARMVLLAVFFVTSWVDLYVIVAQDATVVPRSDFYLSAAATVLSVPVTVLILAALSIQAWSMLRLWGPLYKLPAAALSLVLVLLTVAFNMMTTVIQTRAILYADISQIADWVRQTYLGLITASICWFCFLFNIRLVMHMWTNRSILPSLKGLKAMDVLVITNGILMFVPVIFAALEFVQWDRFEPGSITQTSVIIVLPLGTLVAQRLANPAWFGTGHCAADTSSSANTTGSGAGGSSALSRGALSGTTTATSARRPLLTSVRSNTSAELLFKRAVEEAEVV
ncbi:fungal pheromone mating factor STE2 GPCR-domain-containing protein [Chaetomium fimeti]|uniref:Fungal pheromone mating factor STE2 GPCR-domain-containing protein n=1 Tax=Chaetomium fimeti TaxID=1854472 RepID=A0AAE0H8A9_9PEZI|nr:fungal pheromone mating factor STE2 GPCR-domain-containing protein [Chaetomium fimeti]